LSHLKRLYKREDDDITSQPMEDREVDFRIILGNDYYPCDATKLD
jgi:hypothetical protein